ncbi:metacaspase-2-like isoform X2 [Aphidius gifuensis]|uniref:metacaspase-2-like isoform X2 n=1 Tax=Aphidius gifuensis TaxID=684658 RepID=UPI001CDCD49A|nr:metacaspase-2-like isoform X2 [Aphidius gifuensis]
MALTSTLVEQQQANDKDIHQEKLTALQESISNANKKAAFLENNFYNLREQYKNSARKYDDNNLILKSFGSIDNDNETEQIIKTPEVFFSPRKDDRYHDAENNDNDHLKYNQHDETESPTYTARSFRIKSNDYFDESSQSDYDNNNDDEKMIKINKKINQHYENNNWLPNLWNEKSVEQAEFVNYNVSEMMLTKLASSRKTIISSRKNKSLSKSHFNNKKHKVSARKDYENNSVKVKKVKLRKTNKRVKQTASKSTTASVKHMNILPEGKHLRKHSNRRGKRLKINKIETPKQVDDEKETNKIIEIIETNENKKEIVELFSNTAAKSDQSLSATSSDTKFKLNIVKSPLRMVDKKIKKSIKNQNIIEEKNDNLIKPDGDTTTTTTLSSNVDIFYRKKENEIKLPTATCNFSCDNQSLASPTYQRPTIASQQKRKNRCYYGRYSYQYIPFVVGTSINRTHNIGLNIQLAMSLMKARHTNEPADIRPMLIKKFRRGLNPAYNLKDNFIKLEENFKETNIELTQSQILQQTQQQLNKETQNRNNIDMNDIRNIMIELHNNFEKLQLKQEKLQDEAEKSTDKKKIDAELKKLEIELTIKEKEINQVVALYHEIKKTTTVNENSRTASTSTRLTALLRKIQSFQQQLISL